MQSSNLTDEEKQAIVEAVLFSLPRPASIKEIAGVLSVDEGEAADILNRLKATYDRGTRGIQIVEVAHGFQMVTRPCYAPYLEKIEQAGRTPQQLSRAALETLAIIAYREPITRAEIEAIRGVKADAVLATLLDRGLIRESGRKDSVGRPILYSTTPEFLRYFGLKSLDDLPPLQHAGSPALRGNK